MDNLTFQNESPSDVDAFKGESHDRVAHAMHEYIIGENNHRVIGLDGEFGSGKSSILQMLEKKIQAHRSNSKLWIFDCEQNYQGSIKSNFIELLTEQVITLLKDEHREKDIPDVIRNRDIALGRHFTYTKDTRSHISIWAILLIASGVLSPTFIRDYLIQLRSDSELSVWLHALYLIACTAPASILGLAYWASRKEQDPKKRWNLSSLLKGSSDDRINETIEVSKEVSPLDLKRALAKHLHAVKSHHFIIVIDNLDRLPRDVLRSVWSDLEIFTSVTGTENLSVIVPFCSTKVSKYLNGDGEQSYDSKDFIAKKFPVVFRTPPIITSGWKNAFKTLWTQSFGDSNLSDADACSAILQRHSPMAGGLVTPRLQKRFINDIATTLLVTAGKPSVVCIAAYVAICKYNGIAIEAMLKDPDSPNVDGPVASITKAGEAVDEAGAHDLDKTKRALKALLGEDMKTGWPIQVLQIHFQTSSEIAIAELIDQPLANTLESQDGKKLASLIPYFGFTDSFVRALEAPVSANNLFQTLHQASKVEGCSVGELLPYVSANFGSGEKLRKETPEASYFQAIKELIRLGLNREIFRRALADAKKAFSEMMGAAFDPELEHSYDEIISRYDSYLDAMGEVFEPLTLGRSEMLFHMIMPNSGLKIVDASKIYLNSDGLADAVRQLSSTDYESLEMAPLSEGDWQNCFITYLKGIKIASLPRSYFLNDEDTAAIAKVISTAAAEERAWLAAVLFGKYSNTFPQLMHTHLSTSTSSRIKVAMAVMYIRQDLFKQLSDIPGIDKAIIEEKEYFETLLRVATSSLDLFKATLHEESSEFIARTIAALIKENAFETVSVGFILENYADLARVLEAHGLSEDELLDWFTSIDFDASVLPGTESLDTLMLEKILSGSNARLLALRDALLDKHFGAAVDPEAWRIIIESPGINEKTTLDYIAEAKLGFSGETAAHKALSSFLSATVKKIPFALPQVPVISNTKAILKLLDKDTRTIVGTELRPMLYDANADIESAVFVLAEYGDLLTGIAPRSPAEEERLLQLLGHMHGNLGASSEALRLLDTKSQQLVDWSIAKEHKDTYASLVTKLKAHLPRIYTDLSRQHGFRTRMKEMTKSLLGKS